MSESKSTPQQNRTIIVPFIQEKYSEIIKNPQILRKSLEMLIDTYPELFPAEIKNGVENGNLVISTCFAPYQEPVNIYLGMTLDDPDFSSFFFMFNTDDQLDFFTDTLFPWCEMTSDWNEVKLFSVPVILLPKADYTFYFLITDDPDDLSCFDLRFFTIKIE